MAGMRSLCRAERKELKTLADDFGLFHRDDVRQIIAECKSYAEGQRKIMEIYDRAYMK